VEIKINVTLARSGERVDVSDGRVRGVGFIVSGDPVPVR